MDVCPTQAFPAPQVLDARRCISYLTIEYKGSIDPQLRPLMGNRIFGCDDCQLICPWNRFASHSGETDFKPRHGLDDIDLAELFSWDEAQFLQKTEGSAIRRTGYEGWLRNLAIALGNSNGGSRITAALQARRSYPSPLVQEHVEWALARLQQRGTAVSPNNSTDDAQAASPPPAGPAYPILTHPRSRKLPD
jgi:epoxyqueuosine reductase